ncbi:glycosyltransferase [Adhaeribacter radiodurans]|uniref:Glycosyltransferase n=1 Tax=Adhaeribacter radiodurans TaxID=2745197 RepID=A0A7L7L3D0_9BACT|nr:glycosyltransferase [Adhaeribacter radiodurans]QMU27307.1 glycosyltransferase [Adhaeribacter radiodurans]
MLPVTLLLVLLVCVLVQAAYAFYYFYPLSNYTAPNTTTSQVPVTVIICAHNEYENLQELLPALLSQEYSAFEIIVVNDRSTDETANLIRQWQRNYSQVRLVNIYETPAGFNSKKYALTLGIRVARYEYLLLTDADCKPLSNNWIESMQRGFARGADVIIGYSPYVKQPGFLNYLIRYETLLTAIQYLSFSLKKNAYMAVGRNVAYTKKCFYQNKGFASHIRILGGDDDLFVQDAVVRSTIDIEISKDAQTISKPKQTYSEWITQKRRHLQVGLQYKLSDRLRIGTFMLSNIFFYLIWFLMLLLQQYLWLLGILFLVRIIVLLAGYARIARKLNEQQSVIKMVALDAAYFLHYLFLGVSVLMFKKVRWK